MPNSNYARQLRFTIRQKLENTLGNPNGHEQKRYNFVTQDINDLNTNIISPERKQGRPVESAGGGKANSHL